MELELLKQAAFTDYRAALAARTGMNELAATLTTRAADYRRQADSLEKDFQ